MKLRDYQLEAVKAVPEKWKEDRSTVVVLPTGCGKTVVFGAVTDERLKERPAQKVMILAHREELIHQAKEKVGAITGKECDVEMGAMKTSPLFKADVIVSSIQTQITGRMKKFDPMEFSTLIIDEAHHATAKSYRKVLEYYYQNPDLKVLGVTATPDRADEKALGEIFDSVAYEYSVLDAIKGGWLVPVKQKMVEICSLDFSNISTCAGDFNQGELAEILEDEKNLHGIASATLQIVKNRRAIIFAASVKQAERLCEILNRHRPCSDSVCGTTPKDKRSAILADFKNGKIQIMVNVGVLTEGFDDSGVEVVVMARPTKSRALYAQMAGRATRPHHTIAADLGNHESPKERCELIKMSPKPECLIIDFVGNSGKHKLVTTLDILGGKDLDETEEEVRRAVKKICESEEDGADVLEKMEETRKQILEYKAAKAAKLKFLTGTAKFIEFSIDAFDIFDIARPSKLGLGKFDRRKLSFKQREILRNKIKVDPDTLSYADGKALLDEYFSRIQNGLASFAQTKVLKKRNIFFPVGFQEASRIISRIKGVGV